ncbi:MAG TPA: OsmC family protein [Chitinophagales bacterium]|nr:OsmC family protein [Chitinophagales bacterium]
MTSKIIYEGNLRTRMTHLYSGTEVLTDAPLDNQGLAQAFSPTDLVATALGSCMISIMGIKARDMNIDIKGTEADITKVMAADPRRISTVHIVLRFPKNNFSEKEKTILENAARTCPVAKSLHPDLVQDIIFEW